MRAVNFLARQRGFVPAAIIALIALVCATALGRYYLFDRDDPFHCRMLLDSGEWLDSSQLQEWQPPDCMMHSYKPEEAISCFSGQRILFIGDSTVRDTFAAFVRAINPQGLVQRLEGEDWDPHTNLTIHGVRLSFLWDPYFNGTGFDHAFEVRKGEQIPALTIIGTGLWYVRNEGAGGFESWKNTVDAIATMSHGEGFRGHAISDLVVMLPVFEPDFGRFSNDRGSIVHETVSRMNSYLKGISANKEANIALSFNEMASSVAPGTTHHGFGLQLAESLTAAQAQALLNLRCNDQLPKTPPFDRTCCFKYPAPNTFQLALFVFALIVLPIMYRLQCHDRLTKFLPSESALQALLQFGLILSFAYIADRTHLFGKQSKHFSRESFLFLNISISVLGYFLRTATNHDIPFLNNDQLSEWKGWLVVFSLIYQYFGAESPWIYEFTRLFMGMYFFIASYEHTLYFLKTGELGVQRVVSVLVRMNLLNVLLSYSMDTSYQMYYVAPLMSFWFCVVWMTLRIGDGRNGGWRVLMLKFGVSAFVVIIFTKIPGVLEAVFAVLRMLAKVNWNADEWRFRVGLDMWLVYAGMIVASISTYSSEITSLPSWPILRTFAVSASLVTTPMFLLFQATQRNTALSDTWHPFISVFPVLSFIVLRNSTARLRNTHSTVFAWLGQFSLEIFVLQFHIWLAGDSNGILVFVGPSNWRWVSLLVGTTIFVFICWKVGAATGVIVDWILGRQADCDVPAVVDAGDMEASQKEEDGEIGYAAGKDEISVTIAKELSFREKLGKVLRMYWDDLRIRFAITMASLWILNLVVPSVLPVTNTRFISDSLILGFSSVDNISSVDSMAWHFFRVLVIIQRSCFLPIGGGATDEAIMEHALKRHETKKTAAKLPEHPLMF